jgi:polysaccharide export outer membrane protein
MIAIRTSILFLLAAASSALAQTTLNVPLPASAQQECVARGDCPTGQPPGQGAPGTQAPAGTVRQRDVDPTTEPPQSGQPEQPRPVAGTPEEPAAQDPNEFQKFVRNSLGRDLPIYGASLFDRVPSTFAPLDRAPVPADYVIGPGDEMFIRAWGSFDLQSRVLVDRNGQIHLPKVGSITVAGLKHSEVTDYLKTAIGRVFRNFELNVALGQLRAIQVFVLGQARRPGVYTVSSLSTLVNTLFSSGGPSTRGSMRRIQLKRRDQVVTEFDLYDLLLKGDKSKDATLLPGDVIFIPSIGPQVALAGSVNVPAIYEIRDESTLADVMALAGGLSATAEGRKATIERIAERRIRRVDEFLLDAEGLARKMQDGDLVRLLAISPKFENAVTLRGNVAQPGRYPWREGMRVSDLIPSSESLFTREYWDRQNAVVSSRDDKAAAVGESILRNEVKRSGPDVNWDYALIQRINSEDLSSYLIPFNLRKAVIDRDPEQNVLLQAGDTVTVFSQADMEVPLEKQSKFVRLEGEFAAAGVYRVQPGETLRQLVARVGLTPHSYLFGSFLTRESARIKQQQGLDRLAADLEAEVERSGATQLRNADATDAVTLGPRLERQRNFVAKFRQLKATGRIVLELQPGVSSIDELPEITLEDGDRFFVPYAPSTVEVLGSVYNQNSFLFRRRKTVGEYLKQAGGTTKYADRGRMFIIRADGTVVSAHQRTGLWRSDFQGLELYPGDTVVVPEELDRVSLMRHLKDWTQVIAQFALGAAAVKVLSD